MCVCWVKDAASSLWSPETSWPGLGGNRDQIEVAVLNKGLDLGCGGEEKLGLGRLLVGD